MRILVTGGAGFVGANLARRLVEEGREVHLLVRPGASTWRLEGIEDAVRLVPVDLADAAATRAAVERARPDRVFHLAARGGRATDREARAVVETNVLGTVHLLDACAATGVGALVHAGSSSEYGVHDGAPPETARLEPGSLYAIAKAAATQACRLAAREGRVPTTTLRLYSVYGPWEDPARFVPTLVRHGLAGELPPLARPELAHDFVHVDDVVECFLRAAARRGGEPGAVYNVGTGVQVTLAGAVEVARRVLGVAARPRWGEYPDRDWDATTWVADPGRARAELGWRPRHDFESGLSDTVAWTRRRGGWIGLDTPRRTVDHLGRPPEGPPGVCPDGEFC